MNGGLLRIRESLHNIKRSEQNAAHCILANPDEVIRLSIKELAEGSESSQAPSYGCAKVSVSLNNLLSLRETIKILETKAVEQAIGELFRATRIDFYGVGALQLVAQDA
ncbi:hypothetical protein ABER61_22835 [Brevibacillus formosus]|uniref:MurR/RpiR family transcriptional regulator n=1 Tax=Brevibacillus formosus TaxID=54913 RepID=UPI001F3F762C|nr:hypothetical protein [Brevibacillus formosus]MED1959128.1 hypothetical protein [Brevibacillus formosus]